MRMVARICTHLDKKVPWDDQPERDDWTTMVVFALARTLAPVTNTPLFIHRFNRLDQTLIGSGREKRVWWTNDSQRRFRKHLSQIAQRSQRDKYGLILSRRQTDLVYLSAGTSKSRETEKNFFINYWRDVTTAVRSSNFYFFPINNYVTSLQTDGFDRFLFNETKNLQSRWRLRKSVSICLFNELHMIQSTNGAGETELWIPADRFIYARQ